MGNLTTTDALLGRSSEMNSQDIATTVWALAKLESFSLIEHFVGIFVSLPCPEPRHQVAIAHALAQCQEKSGIGPNGRAQLHKLAVNDANTVLQWPLRVVSSLLYTLARTGTETGLFAALTTAWHPTLPVQECSNVLWALATVRCNGPLVGRLERLLNPEKMRPEELASSAWAFSVLSHRPAESWRDGCTQMVIEKIDEYKPQEMGIILRAMRHLSIELSRVWDVASKNLLTRTDLSQYQGRDVIECLCALEIPVPLVARRLYESVRWDDPSVDDQTLARFLSALQMQNFCLRHDDRHQSRVKLALKRTAIHGRLLASLAHMEGPRQIVVPENVASMSSHDVITACFAYCLWHSVPPLWLLRSLELGSRGKFLVEFPESRNATTLLQIVCLAMFGCRLTRRPCIHAEETKFHIDVTVALKRLKYTYESEHDAFGFHVDILILAHG